MATQRPVCPACGDTREIRADGMSVGCPFHGEASFVQMDSEASAQIRERILEHARQNPKEQISPEPRDWKAIAGDPGRAHIALGRLLMVVSALIVITVVAMVVLW